MPNFFPCRHIVSAIALCAAFSACASDYPARPVTLINPYPAGSASDITARQFAVAFEKELKQSVIVMNKPGAGGLIGTRFVAAAEPDGYTLLMGAIGTHVFNPMLHKSPGYDPVTDFQPVSRIIAFPNVLVVRADLGVSSVDELIKLAKAAPQPLIYGTGGNGTTSHIAASQFEYLTKSKFVPVNFQGTNNAVTEVLAGRVDFLFGNINVVLPHIATHKLKPLAIASSSRYPQLPDVPTFNELGMPEMEMSVWSGVFLPAKTPDHIRQVLSAAVKAAGRSKALQQQYRDAGATVEIDETPEAFAKAIQADTEKWGPVVKRMGIQVQ